MILKIRSKLAVFLAFLCALNSALAQRNYEREGKYIVGFHISDNIRVHRYDIQNKYKKKYKKEKRKYELENLKIKKEISKVLLENKQIQNEIKKDQSKPIKLWIKKINNHLVKLEEIYVRRDNLRASYTKSIDRLKFEENRHIAKFFNSSQPRFKKDFWSRADSKKDFCEYQFRLNSLQNKIDKDYRERVKLNPLEFKKNFYETKSFIARNKRKLISALVKSYGPEYNEKLSGLKKNIKDIRNQKSEIDNKLRAHSKNRKKEVKYSCVKGSILVLKLNSSRDNLQSVTRKKLNQNKNVVKQELSQAEADLAKAVSNYPKGLELSEVSSFRCLAASNKCSCHNYKAVYSDAYKLLRDMKGHRAAKNITYRKGNQFINYDFKRVVKDLKNIRETLKKCEENRSKMIDFYNKKFFYKVYSIEGSGKRIVLSEGSLRKSLRGFLWGDLRINEKKTQLQFSFSEDRKTKKITRKKYSIKLVGQIATFNNGRSSEGLCAYIEKGKSIGASDIAIAVYNSESELLMCEKKWKKSFRKSNYDVKALDSEYGELSRLPTTRQGIGFVILMKCKQNKMIKNINECVCKKSKGTVQNYYKKGREIFQKFKKYHGKFIKIASKRKSGVEQVSYIDFDETEKLLYPGFDWGLCSKKPKASDDEIMKSLDPSIKRKKQ